MSMCNNDVTYADKWDTPENQAALAELERKYFPKSECGPHCPAGWAPEVLEMMDNIERELGFLHNESTMQGYRIQGTPKDWFIVNPWKGLLYAFKRNVFESPNDYIRSKGMRKIKERIPRPISGRVKAIISAFFQPMGYGLRALRIRYVNSLLNKLQRRKVRLAQLKEKFGYLTLYYSCNDAYKGFVEKEIKKCAIKLAVKGAYYPIETLWDAGVSYNIENEYEPDSVKVEEYEYNGERQVKLTKTTYRKVMKELGLDLKDIEQKAILRKASKADPV
jgi:hypothetical protein